MRRNRR